MGHPIAGFHWCFVASLQRAKYCYPDPFSLFPGPVCVCFAEIPFQGSVCALSGTLFVFIDRGRTGTNLSDHRQMESLGCSPCLPLLVVGLFLQPTLLTFENFVRPYNGSDLPVVEYVAENRSSDDTIYVYHIGDSAFHYYAPLYGIDTKNVVTGINSRQKRVALKSFYEDVETLKGNNRVWFIFSGLIDCDGCEGDKHLFYVNYLNERRNHAGSFPGNRCKHLSLRSQSVAGKQSLCQEGLIVLSTLNGCSLNLFLLKLPRREMT